MNIFRKIIDWFTGGPLTAERCRKNQGEITKNHRDLLVSEIFSVISSKNLQTRDRVVMYSVTGESKQTIAYLTKYFESLGYQVLEKEFPELKRTPKEDEDFDENEVPKFLVISWM